MTDFIAQTERPLLERHGLADFQSLWEVQLDAVDEPNTGRGGWSSVFRLELEGSGFYLKRQSNYLMHTWHHPVWRAFVLSGISQHQPLRKARYPGAARGVLR